MRNRNHWEGPHMSSFRRQEIMKMPLAVDNESSWPVMFFVGGGLVLGLGMMAWMGVGL